MKRFSSLNIKKAYKQISPLVKKRKAVSYITLTLTFLTLSFFGLFAIRPTLITAITLVKKVSDLNQLNATYENKINSIVRGQFEYEQIRNDVFLIQQAIPQRASFNKLSLGLEKFASLSAVVIDHLQIGDVPISKLDTQDKLRSYDFNMIVHGNYPSLVTYLSHLTNWKRIITLSELEFTKDTSTTSGLLRLKLSGKAYYEP